MELSRPRVVVAAADAFARLTTADSSAAPNASLVRPLARHDAISHARGWIIALALIATVAKLVLAFNTFGTNDVAMFYRFGHALTANGLEWTYRYRAPWADNHPVFNHPPLTAHLLRFIFPLQNNVWLKENGITFPFLLRLPGIIADFVVVVLVMKMSILRRRLGVPVWSLVLFALSPVSLMVSGFHGNTDPIMVLFFALGALAVLQDRAWLCGVSLAIASQIKIVPLLFLPVFVFFWLHRHRLREFSFSFVATAAALSWEMLLHVDLLARDVLAYGSYWGLWGITYWLRLTHWPQFGVVSFYGLPPAELWIMNVLKLLTVAAVSLLGWRRRKLEPAALIHSLGWSFVVFFILSPGVSAQYLVWLAPFVLFLSPRFYAWFTTTSALFLFFFYDITAQGLPWYYAMSTDQANMLWGPWSIWPWITLIAGAYTMWRQAQMRHPGLRLLSLATVVEKIDNRDGA